MSKRNRFKYPLVLIVWDDHSSTDKYVDEADIQKMDISVQIANVGWLVKEDKKAYTVAACSTTDNDFTDITRILKATVITKEVIMR